ncbi:MAG: insulinase family protein [Vulcanimicrobiota bacterium]
MNSRPALVSPEGSHPRFIVQTVPQASTTATCLAIRYAEPGSVRPPAGAAHLLEHLLFRSRLGQKPGALLLRNELLGDSCRAWVTSDTIVFSEVVPSENGLESLKLQLSRLKGVPDDEEGLRLERAALKKEIAAVASEEEKARRAMLDHFGLEPYPEGVSETLDSFTSETLQKLLEGLSLEDDVVISVVGPHTDREVRKVLSETLAPLTPSRESPRERALAPQENPGTIRVASTYNQTSYFLDPAHSDLRVFRVAEQLAELRLGKGRVAMEKESGSLLRVDLAADASLPALLKDLTPAEAVQLHRDLQRDWLDRYESQQTRAEMFSLSALYGKKPETMVSKEDIPLLFSQSRELLQAALDSETKIVLAAPGQAQEGLYPYRSRAYRNSESPSAKMKLPNGIDVTTHQLDSFPIVAVAGFFRVAPALDSQEIATLKEALGKETSMEYEVTPTGIFFHHWAPARELAQLLSSSADELKRLAEVEDFRAMASPRLSLIEEFFTPPEAADSVRKLRGSRLFQPRASHLVVVGPLQPEELDRGLRPAWSGWFSSAGPAGFSPPGSTSTQELPDHKVVPLPAGSSSALVLGFPGPARSSPDFLPFNLALQTLAGRPNTSLLVRKLNQAKLGVTSVKVFPLPSGSDQENADRQTWLVAVRGGQAWEEPELVVKTISGFLKELGSIKLSSHELELTRDYLKSSLTLSASTIRGRARVLAHSEFYRLSDSYLQDYAGLYDHLTPELVQAICRNYLEQARVRWIYLQPGNQQETANSDQHE